MFRISVQCLLMATPVVAAVDFNRDVQPILNKNCIACHGGVKEAGEVSFIFRDQVIGKGESGETVVVPGKPDVSEMIARITTDDLDDLMPNPKNGSRLSDADASGNAPVLPIPLNRADYPKVNSIPKVHCRTRSVSVTVQSPPGILPPIACPNSRICSRISNNPTSPSPA